MRKLRQVLLKTRRLFLFSICFIMCVFTIQPATVSKAIAAQSVVELNASLNDNSIVVESKSIKNTQIWGYYYHHWFIIKDFGLNGSSNSQYIINLSSYLSSSGSFLDMRYDSMENNVNVLKLYVKYKRNENSNNSSELFKTFYLDDNNKLAVKLESTGDMDATYDYPISAVVGTPVKFYLQTSEDNVKYNVNILGNGSYEEDASVVTRESNNSQQVFSWTPTESGTFNASVYKGNTVILQRKVYVNSKNNRYLKVSDLNIKSKSSSNSTVDVVFKINDNIDDNTRCGSNSSIEKVSQLVISEPLIWSKTLFSDNYTKIGTGQNSVSGLELGSGKYYFDASIKTANSLENDDIIRESYKVNDGEGDASDLLVECTLNGNPVDITKKNQLNYTVTGAALNFNFNVIGEPIDQYEYAFILFNKRGHVVKVGYDSQKSSFDWTPSASGTYIIHIRMRNRYNAADAMVDNSYVKEVTIPITINEPTVKCKIKSVQINNNTWTINGNDITKGEDYKIYSRKLTSILIDAKNKNGNDNDFMYKVYVSNKGYTYALSPYTYSNSIPFYPKTDGIYHMIVMVKDESSGSYEDKCEFDLNVTSIGN